MGGWGGQVVALEEGEEAATTGDASSFVDDMVGSGETYKTPAC